MRSIALTAIFMLILASVFAHPWIGAFLYMWISVMNPHKLTYGFATGIPFALIAAVVTLIALVISEKRRAPPKHPIVFLLLALTLWMCVTTVSAFNPNTSEVHDVLIMVLKTQLMVFVTMVLVYERSTITWMMVILVGSVAFYGFKGGLWTIFTGGSGTVWGPPASQIEGNNELGLALVTMLPLMYFVYEMMPKFWLRMTVAFVGVMCMFAVLGTHSRGALLALVAMSLFLGLKSKRPLVFSAIFGLFILLGIAFMPDNWVDRMETIRTYGEDASAMSRLHTWSVIWRSVLDNPIFGSGFRLDNYDFYARYSSLAVITTTYGPHSIYFQALGEHGFVGLALYLALLGTTWITLGRLSKRFAAIPEETWAALLCRMLQVGLVGFMVGGNFLGLLHWDVHYYLIALVVVLYRYSEGLAPEPVAVRRETAIGMRYGRYS
jgi:putative inorganic carbon (hco3(-)) transporter